MPEPADRAVSQPGRDARPAGADPRPDLQVITVLGSLAVALAAAGATGAFPAAGAVALLGLVAIGLVVHVPASGVALLLIAASSLSGLAVPAGNLNVRPEQVAGAVCLLALPFRRDAGRLPRLALLPVLWILAGLAGALGEPEAARAGEHGIRLLATCAPVVVVPSLLKREDAEKAWDRFLVLSSCAALFALLCLGANLLFGTRFGVTVERTLGYVHPHGTYLEPNVLGAISAAAAVPLLARAIASGTGGRRRVAAVLLALPLVVAVAASLTRAAWIALPAGLLVAAALAAPSRPGRKRGGRLALIGLASAATLALVFLVVRPALPAIAEARSGVLGKVASIGRLGEDPNVLVRLRTYEVALSLWKASPLFGAGHGAMERLRAPEDATLAWAGNLEVHALADTGLVGLVALAAFAASVALTLLLRGRTEPFPEDRRRQVERLSALAVLLLCAQATETSWLASFWVLFALALAGAGPRRTDSTEPRPTRILFVHPSDELYGSDRVLLELVRGLDRSRYAPTVVVSCDVPYAGRLTRRLLALDVPVTSLRIGVLRRQVLSSPVRLARYAVDVAASTLRLTWILVRERTEIVHANTVTVFPAAFAAALAGRPLVWHLHEIVTERRGRAFLHVLVRLFADRIVVVSGAARESLGRGTSRTAEVVPNGVEPRPEAPPAASPPTVAYIGRLSRRKGPDVFVRAAALVSARHPDVRFLVAGDEFGGGEDVARGLRAEATRLGLARLELRPFREEVWPLLAEVAIVVAPSVLPESFGLVLLEAMVAGRVVVASDHGGPRELIEHGETGFLVPPGDAGALASAIDTLLSDPARARRMGEAGRRRALAHFPLERSVSRFSALYDELTRGSGDRVRRKEG